MGRGGTPQSPFVYDSGGDYRGNNLRVTVTYNNSTRALTGASITRDPGCVYSKIYLGVGVDGTPNSTPHQVSVPVGTLAITTAQLAAIGLNLAEDIYALQVTAGA